ncbi:polysaccharide biosynthesis protein [Terrisporobacter petrolearius]|uniref:putative polysaccharide biosynthesis protein n=1 Tax=Terrisporobacter petrolearius TaxID=1460447 RepID=UPI0031CC517F
MNNNAQKESFLKGALILGMAGIIVKIMGAFFRIPLGNIIGSTGLGYYQAVYPVYTLFLTLATAGFPTALAKLVSEQRAVGDFGGANKTFKISYTVLFITGLISFSFFFFGADFISTVLLKNSGSYAALIAISPALLFVPLMSSYRGYFQGRREMSKIAVSQIIEQFFRVVLGLLLAYMLMKNFGEQMGAAGGVLGAAIGGFASAVFLIYIYLKGSKSRKAEIAQSKHIKLESTGTILKRLLYVAIPISIGACVMPLVNMVDSVIVVRRLTETGFNIKQANSLLGQLSGMAISTVNLLVVIDQAIGMSLVPSISEAYALKQMKRVRKEAKTGLKTILLVTLPATFGFAALAGPIMKLLYPAEPATLGTMLFVVSPCAVFLGLIYAQNGILQGMGKPMMPVIALAIGMVFKVVISYVLTGIPSINIIGSGVGTLAAYAVASIIEFIYIKKHLKLRLSPKEFIIKPMITVITMYVVVKLSYGIMVGFLGNSLSTLVSIAIGGVVYGLVLLGIGGIRKEEILTMPKGEKIYSILRKLKVMK